MKKRIILVISLVILISLILMVLFTGKERYDIYLKDFTVSLDENVMTLKIGVTDSLGYVRKMKQTSGSTNYYYTFYSTFGINSKIGAKDTFTIKLDQNVNEIYFYIGNGGYKKVLQKDNNKWHKVDSNLNNENIDDNKLEEISDETLVNITDYIPNAIIDLKYATTDNFTKQIIYDNEIAYLRYGTVMKLLNVQHELNNDGYTLVIWDAYRSTSAQFKLWEICPDSKYVSNPYKGFSSHSRGNTIDITIAKLDGTYLEMPSKFDDFSSKADRNYDDVSIIKKNNAIYLENIMEKKDFKGYKNEWWHYTDNQEYDVIK